MNRRQGGEFITHQDEFVTQDSPILALNKVFIVFGGQFKNEGKFEILGGEFEIRRWVWTFIHLQIDQSKLSECAKK